MRKASAPSRDRVEKDAGGAEVGSAAEHGPEARGWKLETGCVTGIYACPRVIFQLFFEFPASRFQLLAPSSKFNASATARMANGNARTCGCMSPSRKLKNGNSSMTSMLFPGQILVVDHARRVPPPPEASGQVTGRRVVSELFDVQPLEPLQRNQALVIRQLDQPFKVAQETDEQRAEQSIADAAALTVRGAWCVVRIPCRVRLNSRVPGFQFPVSSFQLPASSFQPTAPNRTPRRTPRSSPARTTAPRPD